MRPFIKYKTVKPVEMFLRNLNANSASDLYQKIAPA